MTIDMSQFYRVFFEEAAEHLGEMERLLLSLDVDAPNPDDLNAIFRAAHSIKGGSGTFGFTDMTEVTHVLESLLDKLRKGELALRSDMIDAFLEAGDVLGELLAGHQTGAEVDETRAAAVCAKLNQLVRGEAVVPAHPPSPPSPTIVTAETGRLFHIEFTPDPETLRTIDLDNLFTDLGALGKLQVTEATSPSKKGRKKPPRTWQLNLQTTADEGAIRDIFDFVAQPEQVRIETAPPPAQPTEEELGYGFFTEIPAPQPTEEELGYGFFEPIAPPPETAQEEAQRSGRRASDDPQLTEARTGRRATDKVAVSPQAESASIRVGVEKVDQLINLVGELVITQAMLAQTASQLDRVLYEKLLNGMTQLERNTRDLQESVMSIRMMPIGFVFSRFPRVVRDLAAKLNKKVELKTHGEGTELDKGLIEKMADPLTHLIRNSLDHGIESPEQRVAAGKPPQGTIRLEASHQGGYIVIVVSDDGAGLNRDKILKKARERGLPVSDAMSDGEVWKLIFEPGFSTADVVTDVSGRGVGMDVVTKNIQAMGGQVDVESVTGVGTRTTIRLPLTLAILDGMSVAVGGEIFIIPLTYIAESLQPTPADVKTVSGEGRVVQVRGEYLPLVALFQVFGITPRVTEPHEGIVVLLEAEGRKAALFVDELVGQHQVVIKNLETNYRRVAGISAATIMGDGKVALILDVAALMRMSQGEGKGRTL